MTEFAHKPEQHKPVADGTKKETLSGQIMRMFVAENRTTKYIARKLNLPLATVIRHVNDMLCCS